MIETIKSGNTTAKIDSLGAQWKSFQKDGKEYLWQGNPAVWKGQAPILFPVVARCRGDKLTIQGKEYPMPKHGFLRDHDLKVTQKTENAVTFTLTDNEETKTMYPWSFETSITFTLEENKLTCAFRVENKDETQMFFGIGGHPAFNVPIHAGEKFEDYQLEFEVEEILKSNHVDEDFAIMAEKKDLILESGRVLPLKRPLFDNDAMIFEDIESKWVKLVHKDTKAGIHFAYDDFPVLAVWTMARPIEGNYVCLEPWHSMGFRDNERGVLEEKYGILSLMPGGVFEAAFSAEIID